MKEPLPPTVWMAPCRSGAPFKETQRRNPSPPLCEWSSYHDQSFDLILTNTIEWQCMFQLWQYPWRKCWRISIKTNLLIVVRSCGSLVSITCQRRGRHLPPPVLPRFKPWWIAIVLMTITMSRSMVDSIIIHYILCLVCALCKATIYSYSYRTLLICLVNFIGIL